MQLPLSHNRVNLSREAALVQGTANEPKEITVASPVSGAYPRRAVLAVTAVAIVGFIALVASDAVSVPFAGAKPATTALDETIASRSRQIAMLDAQTKEFGCDAPVSSDQIAGCSEMHGKLASMEAELVALKARAGGRWLEGGQIIRTQGFFERLFGGGFRGRAARRAERAPRALRRRPRESQTVQRGGTIRTMCVRTCDGYYWPVSFATSRDRLSKDARACETSCGSPAKLYYYDNPGEGIGDMVDMRGKRYADTPTAFKHQVEFDKNCRCSPEPWTPQAQAAYAARGQAKIASKKARKGDVHQASARQESRRSRSARRKGNRSYSQRRYSRRDAYALGYDR